MHQRLIERNIVQSGRLMFSGERQRAVDDDLARTNLSSYNDVDHSLDNVVKE